MGILGARFQNLQINLTTIFLYTASSKNPLQDIRTKVVRSGGRRWRRVQADQCPHPSVVRRSLSPCTGQSSSSKPSSTPSTSLSTRNFMQCMDGVTTTPGEQSTISIMNGSTY